MTKLAQQGLGTRRQRSGHTHDKAWAHGDNALGMRTARHGYVYDKDVHTTEEFYRDRDFSVTTDLGSDEKKKTLGI